MFIQIIDMMMKMTILLAAHHTGGNLNNEQSSQFSLIPYHEWAFQTNSFGPSPYNKKHLFGVSIGPTRVHEMVVSNCSDVIVRGFLKHRCLINNHWYYKCRKSYRFYKVLIESGKKTIFSRVCPNDPTFYQACGHNPYRRKDSSTLINDPKIAVCGQIICQELYTKVSDDIPLFGVNILESKMRGRKGLASDRFTWSQCDGVKNCDNLIGDTPVDEYKCNTGNESAFNCKSSFLEKISMEDLCDNNCDCGYFCEDEANCNNMTFGTYCVLRYSDRGVEFVPPHQICDGYPDCMSGVDEMFCKYSKEHCRTKTMSMLALDWQSMMSPEEYGRLQRPLVPRSKCFVISAMPLFRVCEDYRDQMNCTNSTISPLTCNVEGFPTTLSEHVLCKQLNLCDDNLDNECVDAEFQCKIHKHRICDGNKDCPDGNDESGFYCDTMTPPNIGCVRRLSYSKSEVAIPSKWLFDGINDCESNIDEMSELWDKSCSSGILDVYVLSNTSNQTDCDKIAQLLCPGSSNSMDLERICLGRSDNCDNIVCNAGRKDYQVVDKVQVHSYIDGFRSFFYCIQGLKDLEFLAGDCSLRRFAHQVKLEMVPDLYATFPEKYVRSHINCQDLLGELYVYVTCSELCFRKASCPVGSNSSLESAGPIGNCMNFPKENIAYTMTEDDYLALVLHDKGSFDKAFFSCNNRRCIPFEKVCNLANDCGDFSDEESCSNNFKCKKSGEYIPISRKCDGRFDCFDYTDECNKICDNQVKMFEHLSLFIITLIFGLIATFLNLFTLFHSLKELPSLKTEVGIINKFFVLLITFGDLLQGIFLLLLSIGDKYLNNSTCTTQFEWTTSSMCVGLGILSTTGSLVSLYSMTVLSIIRVCKIKGSLAAPKEGISTKKKIFLVAIGFGILGLAVLVASLPQVAKDDYFVQDIYYSNNPLFLGAQTKAKHFKIFEAYYGRVYKTSMRRFPPWKTIKNLVKNMFSENLVTGKNIGFYGSNGFCLFSYFVTKKDSFRAYSLAIITSNLFCVVVIGLCYFLIRVFSKKTSSAATSNPRASKNIRKLQRKVTIIIASDVLTWLPFILVVFVNYSGLVDTSGWYFVFCIFFQPINSIINPIGIYDDTIFTWFRNIFLKIKLFFVRYICSSASSANEEIEMTTFNRANRLNL